MSPAYSTVSQDFGKLRHILGVLTPGLVFAADGHAFRNAIATVVSTRVLSPRKALLVASALNTLGAFYGIKVAQTIGKGIVRSDVITLSTIAAAMIGIVIWRRRRTR